MDERFGRASCFVVVDTETGDSHTVDNTRNLEAAQGAGVQAAQAVVAQGVAAVLTGHCGPKAFKVLQAAGIEIYVGVSGTVAAVAERFRDGRFDSAASPDVQGHW